MSYRNYDIPTKYLISKTRNPNLFPEKNIPISTAKYWIKNRVHLKLRPQVLPNNGHRKLTDVEIKKIKEENFILRKKLETICKAYKILKISPKNQNFLDSKMKNKFVSLIQRKEYRDSIRSMLKEIDFPYNRYKRWRREKESASKDICVYEQSHRRGLTTNEIQILIGLYTDKDLFHFPLHALVAYAKRNDLLHSSPSTYSKYAKRYKLKRPKSFHKQKSNYPEGIKGNHPNNLWHIDVTEVKLLKHKVFIQVIIDNYSKMIIGWSLQKIWNGRNTKSLIAKSILTFGKPDSLMSDAGKENLNSTVIDFLKDENINHLVAKLNIRYSNSCIETFFRILKYNYLKKLRISTPKQLQSLVEIYIFDYNTKIPHSSLINLTPEEAYFGMPKDFYDEEFKFKAQEAIKNRYIEFNKN